MEMLEVVDMSADIHVHMMAAQDGVYPSLHISSLHRILGRIGVDGMMSHYRTMPSFEESGLSLPGLPRI